MNSTVFCPVSHNEMPNPGEISRDHIQDQHLSLIQDRFNIFAADRYTFHGDPVILCRFRQQCMGRSDAVYVISVFI